MLRLPPCVINALGHEIDFAKYVEVVAAYVKTYVKSPVELSEAVPQRLMPYVMSALTNRNIPTFSCDLVMSVDDSLCDDTKCPLFAEKDPVAFLMNNVEEVVWNLETSDIKIKFRNVYQPLILNAYEAFRNPSDAKALIASFTLQNLGKAIYLVRTTVKMPDGSRHVKDQLRQFLEELYSVADKVYEGDVMGIGELITDILNSHQVVPAELASVESEVFVYIDRLGNRYLAIEPRILRTKARNRLGITSNNKLIRVLSKYNINKTRIRLHGDRKYVFLVPEEVIRRYADVDIDDITRGQEVSESDIMRLLGGGDGE